jgi:hypothetical protein
MERTDGRVLSGVRSILRLEGLMMLGLSVALYARLQGEWLVFAELFLVPDLSIAAYLFGPRTGAAAYNTMHSTIGPLLLLSIGYAAALPMTVPVALIWLAHVGFDRALGYGLKYPSAFGDTHLGRIGRAA